MPGPLYRSGSPRSEQGCSMLPKGLGHEALHAAGPAHAPAHLRRETRNVHEGQ